MPTIGSQVTLCDIPLRMDTYVGCGHGCTYCFAQRKNATQLVEIRAGENRNQVKSFVSGKREKETNWIDFNMPIHMGGMSDPLQPIEASMGITLGCLEEFAESRYPLVISTKGRLIAEPAYLELIARGRTVVQISMCCPGYDEMEPGAPPFAERLEMAERVAAAGVRVIARVQPWMLDYADEIEESIDKFAFVGVYGIVVEGYKAFVRDDPRMIKLGADTVYPLNIIQPRFERLRKLTHAAGLKFYCGENRLRWLGDDLCCCGIDGLEGFERNTFNHNHLFYAKDKPAPRPAQCQAGTGDVFSHIMQTGAGHYMCKELTFAELMEATAKARVFQEIMGVVKVVEQTELFSG